MKGNFHDHTGTWNPIDPKRHEKVEKLFDAYDKHGYHINCLSEYNRIVLPGENPSRKIMAFPSYEHGYSYNKFHQILIGPDNVNYFDFPVYFGSSMRQSMLDYITDKKLMILAHPIRRNSVRFEDMINLGGYDAIEVLNYTYVATRHWDTALSAGNLVWGMASDDTHDYSDKDITFINWTWFEMQPNLESLCNSVKNGRMLMVKGRGGVDKNMLKYCRMNGDTVVAKFENIADSLRVIGQGGRVKNMVTGSDEILSVFSPSDTYLRVEAYTEGSLLLLNPLVRTKKGVPVTVAERHPEEIKWKTWLFRIGLFAIDLVLIMILVALIRRKKRL